MAQMKHWGDIEVEKECRFCKEEKEFSIFWSMRPDDSFYICKDCYFILRGLFIDVLLETEEGDEVTIKRQFENLENKINGIKEMRIKNRK